MIPKIQLLPEWVKQEAVILAWPDKQTDWAPWLNAVQEVYLQIIQTLSSLNVGVILLVKESQLESCKKKLPNDAQVLLVKANYNDTWVRDYAFLTCSDQHTMHPIEFRFNGWGGKFNADTDNKVNQTVLASLCKNKLQSFDLVVEGGALEINQDGLLLSTKLCLTNPERNGQFSLAEYENFFANNLGVRQNVIFENGHLEGDDTDGHIDTLVRFTPDSGLIIQSAFNQQTDPHFSSLTALVNECKRCLPKHKIFELPLPIVIDNNRTRLPASYANFLITNQAVLCPTYQQPEDKQALEVIQSAFPNHKVVPIDCLPLIQQFGSLHCISMQIPEGTLKTEIVQQFAKGVTQYDHQ